MVDHSQLPVGERLAGGQHTVRVELVTVASAVVAVRGDVEGPHGAALQRPSRAVLELAFAAQNRRRGVGLG